MPDSENSSEAYSFFRERFGVDVQKIEGLSFTENTGDHWITSEDSLGLEYETQGIRALRDTGRFLKPTTYVLQLLDEKINRNKVELSEKELISIIDGEMIPVEASEKLEEGYVALEVKGKIIGCGLYKDEVVSSRIPSGRAEELRNFLQEK